MRPDFLEGCDQASWSLVRGCWLKPRRVRQGHAKAAQVSNVCSLLDRVCTRGLFESPRGQERGIGQAYSTYSGLCLRCLDASCNFSAHASSLPAHHSWHQLIWSATLNVLSKRQATASANASEPATGWPASLAPVANESRRAVGRWRSPRIRLLSWLATHSSRSYGRGSCC